MKEYLEITCAEYPSIKLVSAGSEHIELLREWKNHYRDRFFFKDIITPEMQQKWFDGYLLRPDDCMLMVCDVLQNDEPVGCLAFREKNGKIDLYNIIRGVPNKNVNMGDAMHIMLSLIHKTYNDSSIVCDVLKNNPARKWYEGIGLEVIEEYDDHYLLSFEKFNALPLPSTLKIRKNK